MVPMERILTLPALGSKLIINSSLHDAVAMIPASHLVLDLVKPFTAALAFGLTRPRFDERASLRSLGFWQQTLQACVQAAEAECYAVDLWAHAAEIAFMDLDFTQDSEFYLAQLRPVYFARLLKRSWLHVAAGEGGDKDIGIAAVLCMTGGAHSLKLTRNVDELNVCLVASVVTTDGRFATVVVTYANGHAQLGTRFSRLPHLGVVLQCASRLPLDGLLNYDVSSGLLFDRLVDIPDEPCKQTFTVQPWKVRFPLLRKARDSNPYEYEEFYSWYGPGLGTSRWNEAKAWSENDDRLAKILRGASHAPDGVQHCLYPDVLNAGTFCDPIIKKEAKKNLRKMS